MSSDGERSVTDIPTGPTIHLQVPGTVKILGWRYRKRSCYLDRDRHSLISEELRSASRAIVGDEPLYAGEALARKLGLRS
jgi:hypothetical protein